MSIESAVLDHARYIGRNSGESGVQANRSVRQAWESRMDFDCIGEIIATRKLYFVDEASNKRTVSVFVGEPQQSPDSPGYHCPFQVIGIGNQKVQSARGYDSIQALQSALILIAAGLNHLNNEIGGTLNWEGGCKGDLGFP
jgi:hypothetical protein